MNRLAGSRPPLPFVLIALFWVALSAASQAAAQPFSHADWTTVLDRFVDDRGRVNYVALSKDRGVFDRYVAAVETTSPKNAPAQFPTKNDALAYYLNAYNALVFKGVLARGPEDDTVWTPFGSPISFFVSMDVKVGGETTSLKKLEDNLVRAQFGDPRVHAALNCASISCPRLPRKSFEAATLDAELDAAMREFVAETRNVAVDEAGRSVRLSKIFDWFADDFLAFEKQQGNANPNILDYINRYRADGAKIPRTHAVSYFDYNKGINKQL